MQLQDKEEDKWSKNMTYQSGMNTHIVQLSQVQRKTTTTNPVKNFDEKLYPVPYSVNGISCWTR